jgi:hypothetical protein
VTERVEPATYVTAVFGAVTVIRSSTVKLSALADVIDGFSVHVKRILPCVVLGPLTNQGYESDAADVVTKVVTVAQVPPPSRLDSTRMGIPTPRFCVNAPLRTSAMSRHTFSVQAAGAGSQ